MTYIYNDIPSVCPVLATLITWGDERDCSACRY